MKIHENKNTLENLTSSIARSLENTSIAGTADYEYSATYTAPKRKELLGKWKITKHTIGDQSFLDTFLATTWKALKTEHAEYHCEYEFLEHECIKRMYISAFSDGRHLEYRLTMVLLWTLKGDVLSVEPLIGYQCSLSDGTPVAIRELSPGRDSIKTALHLDQGSLILIDGDDRKEMEKYGNV